QSSRVGNTATMNGMIKPEARSRVNNFVINNINHTKLVEGEKSVLGGLAKGLQLAGLQSYRYVPDAPLVAVATAAPARTSPVTQTAAPIVAAPEPRQESEQSSWSF